ncbi:MULTISPECIES: non-ribosomal peptide synthetase [Streptomyces]|uniref:non-ribosomal peptide synthetase n=1 Tax=Streptomyces TaxID=1883 RepID=UPI00103B5E48|nr:MULTISPECIES: non-ribosomal peptide synthetase [Streptomyces]MBT3074761.1 amino acid adenylation domain-containing protein [Streptomyces sp. COG21]MBT3081816.1 amino acid adenylation domain-containing protein [Streptomyces sp. COG20]MBT3090665.1 amino acid adenylation domain-containing protein [Streptomyces sp. CYG21]MBT3098080.1 amino acid adenylation domain-containing protein [Streptomyces sp. CBG30]MBT3105745.1 amino acid adenylation domain-containing protein [Streptomyces sp. COG19]
MAPVDGGYPLSFAQEQLWLLDQLRSGDAAEYLMHETFRIRGPLDTEALNAALTETAARHEVLRTRYAEEDGVGIQIIDEPEPVKPESVDLGDVPDEQREQGLREFRTSWAATPLDIRREHPWRVAVVRLAPEDWALLLTFHHIAFDGWSWGLLADELRESYAAFASGGTPAPEELELQYADYAEWQREWWTAQPELMSRQLDYWRDRLTGTAPLDLPTDRPRPARWDATGDTVAFAVPAPLAAGFSALAKEQGTTLFMAGLTAYQLLLGRYSGTEDIAVGVSLANRDDARLERLIGLFLNTVVVRTDLGGAPDFRELLSRVKSTTLDAYSHQEVPFERVVAALAPERDPGRNPVFQAGFALHNAHRRPFALPGLEVTRVAGGAHSSAFDLSLHLTERPDGTIGGEFIYPTALFDRDRMERMAENFLHLLGQVVASPGTPVDRLELTAPAERAVLTAWGQGASRPAAEDRSGRGLVGMVLDRAAATPDATAVAYDGGSVDYAGLVGRVTLLAARLREEGVRPGTPVAVGLHRGPELVTAILAVLAVGGVHVPLAPDLPDVRREFLLSDSGAALVLTEEALRDRFGGDIPVRALDAEWAGTGPDAPPAAFPHPAGPDEAACVVYTSGSTGTPKGVVVTHGGLRNRVLWSVEAYAMTAADRLLQKTTIGFDASLWEFLSPLVSGGTVVMAPADAHRDPSVMAAAMDRHRVTLLQLVPSVLRLLVQEPTLSRCTALRLVSSAGEPLPARLCEQLRAAVPGVEVSNTYGPTECSIDSTAHRYTGEGLPGSGTVAIGAPLTGVGVSVVDRADLLVPVGVPGELCVRGAGLARGYLGRPGQTAERFGVDPYATVPGGRWYRTGDLVRWRADGTLEFLGRSDDQVKIHGVRVEPAEIEALLLAHPSATASAVVARPGAHGQLELTAYAVPATGTDPAGLRAELLAHLAARLPAAVVPSRLVLLDALPLTASGKVDRGALPGPEDDTAPPAATGPDRAAPRTATEQAVVAAMASVLEIPEPGPDDDFFGLGGHSLLAIRLVLGLRRAFGIEMTVADLFADRTAAALAARIDRATGAAGAEEPGREPGGIVPVERDGALPLSFGQQRMWFLDRLEPGSQEYLIPLALRLRGPLDTEAFRRALDEVARVHEVLRTRYADHDGSPVQLIDPPGPVAYREVDLSGTEDGPVRARELLEEALSVPFDLAAEQPLRVTVIHAAPEDHWVALAAHHIAFDAWSTKVFLRDLDTAYTALAAGREAPLRPGPVQYADFAAWQRAREETPETGRQLRYWLERLGGITPVELPSDRPRGAGRDAAGDTVIVDVPDALGRAVTELGEQSGATPFMTLLGAFQVLLHHYTGRTDIAVGVPVAARTREETEGLLGLFVNSLVIRTDLGGDPAFTALLERVKQVCLEAFAHQDVPFERLVDELATDRDLSRNPLFQVMFEHQHMGGLTSTLGGLAAEPLNAGPRTAKFDLTLTVKERPDGRMHCWFEYASALFDRSTVERMAAHYLRLLESVTAAPDTAVAGLELMPDAERRQVLDVWPDPYAARLPEIVPEDERGLTVPELFVRQAARTPDATALVFGEEELDYAALEARSARFARRLRALGAGPETAVASCQERGIDAVVTLLGVLRAGAVYVPLDPRHPQQRLLRTVEDAGARFLVTTSEHADTLTGPGHQVLTVDALAADGAEGALPDVPAAPENLAYVIYTSGSTGRPKGVMIDHRAYAHHCRIAADAYGIGPGERVAQLSSLTFDVSMEQIAAPLLTGAAVVIADPLFWSPAELPARLAEHGVTVMETTPAYYREAMNYDTSVLTGLKLINLSSDVVTVADARQWAASGLPGRFVCCYGPTEATVTCLLHTGPAGQGGERDTASMPLGRPFPGTRAYVLDAGQRPVPIGVPGELCVGGVRLARGYHGRPELTAAQFVPDPFGGTGERLYRTGDLVRYRPDGTLEFLGRIDQQVKIRGLRIELGEIEAALTGHPGVGAAAVTAPEITPGNRRLAAYVTGLDGAPAPDPEALREHLREGLPDYMVPALWTVLDSLPMTASQKIDRKALPAPATTLERAYVAPRDPVEEAVAAIWAETLGVDRVGAEDDFFALGGHSLLATRVLARLREAFAVELPLRRLFEHTTVTALAAAVTEAVEAAIAQLSDAEVAELLNPEGAR